MVMFHSFWNALRELVCRLAVTRKRVEKGTSAVSHQRPGDSLSVQEAFDRLYDDGHALTFDRSLAQYIATPPCPEPLRGVSPWHQSLQPRDGATLRP